jgi:Plasmid stabilization system protein
MLQAAQDDLARLENFLKDKNPDTAKRMKVAIVKALNALTVSPNSGVSFGRFKRLIVKFGKSKYVVVYNYVKTHDTVYILSMRHSRENPANQPG